MSDKFTFDGDELTIAEIAHRMNMSRSTIQRHFKAGRRTREAMRAFNGKAASSRSSEFRKSMARECAQRNTNNATGKT